jgi:hypothetical protein
MLAGNAPNSLELGSGLHSTGAFLDRRLFPDLAHLDSAETDQEWADKVSRAYGKDGRLSLHLIAGPLAIGLRLFDLDTYDLILVDDSITGAERCETIRAVTGVKRPIVVIHDFEAPLYRRAAKSFQFSFRVSGVDPNVGVLSNRKNAFPTKALR